MSMQNWNVVVSMVVLSKLDSSTPDTSGEVILIKKLNAATTIHPTRKNITHAMNVNMDHPHHANSLHVRSGTPVQSNVPHRHQPPNFPNGLINHGGLNPLNRLLLPPHRRAMNVGGNLLRVQNLHPHRLAKSNLVRHHLRLHPANGLLVQRNVRLLSRSVRN